MTQFDLTDDQRQIQEMAQKFTADAITPNAAEWDEKYFFPRDTIRSAGRGGRGVGSIQSRSRRGGTPEPRKSVRPERSRRTALKRRRKEEQSFDRLRTNG